MLRFLLIAVCVAATLTQAWGALPAGALDPGFGSYGRRMFLDRTASQDEAGTGRIQALYPDGRRIIAGQSSTSRGNAHVALARYLPDGRLDSTFGDDGRVLTDLLRPGKTHETARVVGVALLPGDKIALVANLNVESGYALVCYHGDGSLDTGFGTGGIEYISSSLTRYAFALAVQADGKWVVGGATPFQLVLTRYQVNGSRDTTFKPDYSALRFGPPGSVESFTSMLVQPDGKLVVAGLSRDGAAPFSGQRGFGLLRLNGDGSMDPSFNGTGRVTTVGFAGGDLWEFGGLTLQSDGKMVIAGSTSSGLFILARYLPSGALDTSLGGTGKISTPLVDAKTLPKNIAAQNDGKLIITGLASPSGSVGAATYFFIARLTVAGALDPEFNGTGIAATAEPLAAFVPADVGLDPQGRILIAGHHQRSGETADLAVLRVKPDGSLDADFDGDGSAHTDCKNSLWSRYFSAVAEQPDGKLILAGQGLCRLLPNGALDATFGVNGLAGTFHTAAAVLLQTDGKIVIGSTVTASFGTDMLVSRYLPDGSPDPEFGVGSLCRIHADSYDSFNSLVLQPDGKIIVAGAAGHQFVTARLLENGTLDPAFGSGGVVKANYFPQYASSGGGAALQADGKIIRVGQVAGTVQKFGVVRLNPNGSPDPGFNGTGIVQTAVGTVQSAGKAVAVQPDGKIVVAGYAASGSSYTDRNVALARYLPDGSLDTSFNGTGTAVRALGPSLDEASSILLQSDGKILLIGQRMTTSDRSDSDLAVVRFMPDGSLDSSFYYSGYRLFNAFSYAHNSTSSDDQPGQPALQNNGGLLLPFSADSNLDFTSFSDNGLLRVLTEAVAPKIEVELNGLGVASGAGTLDFGAAYGNSSVRRTLVIRNTGMETLTVKQFTLSGSHAADFSAGAGMNVLPGAAKDVTLTFSPLGLGQRTAMLTLVSNDLLAPSFVLTLTGSTNTLQYLDQLQSQVVREGDAAAFPLAMAGDAPVSFEWLKNGRVMRQAAGPALMFPSVKLGDAGRYMAFASNNLERTPSKEAFLGVLGRAPERVAVVRHKTLSLAAKAASPAGATVNYKWHHNALPLNDGGRVSGAEGKVLQISGMTPTEEGSYTCRVIMTMGTLSVEQTYGATQVDVLDPPVLELLDFSPALVGQSVREQVIASQEPSRFSASGLPPGLSIDKNTGIISGKPSSAKELRGGAAPYQVTITASNAAGKTSQTADWMILPMPAGIAGHYRGLLARQELLNKGLGGTLNLSVQGNAAFTGVLTLGPKRYPFADSVEIPADGGPPKILIAIARQPPLSVLKLTCDIDPQTGALTGAINEGEPDAAVVTAWRSSWSSSNPPDSFMGNYNAALLPQVPESATATVLPHGEGFVMVKVGAAGRTRWVGSLADGSPLTGSAPLGAEGRLALHALFHRDTASLQGWHSISIGTGNLDGTADWLKLPAARDGVSRVYPQGFPLHALTIVGSPYSAPASGQILLGMAPPPLNARLSFACDGGMEDFELPLSILASHKVSPPPNETGFKNLSLNVKTGLFKGSFWLHDQDSLDEPANSAVKPRTATFQGAIIPRLARGAGTCLLPLPAAADEHPSRTRVISGSVSLDRAP